MGKDLKGRELGVGLSQRKDGLYQARYTDRWKKRRTIYNKSIRELRKQLAEAIAENENFTNIREDITLDEWNKKWMMVYKKNKVRPSTYGNYEKLYRNTVSPYIGKRIVRTLVKSDIQNIMDQISGEGYSLGSQKLVRSILHDMLGRAEEDHLIVRNPVSGIILKAEETGGSKPDKGNPDEADEADGDGTNKNVADKEREKVLTKDEENIFFTACKGNHYENLYYVAVNTGLRPGELTALQLGDIDLKKGYIKVGKTLSYDNNNENGKMQFRVGSPKTKTSVRKVPINSVCREYLERQLEMKKNLSKRYPEQQNDFLFVTKKNTPLSVSSYDHRINTVIKKINRKNLGNPFPHFSAHGFRHTFATRCFENGINVKVVQKYLGHSSIKITMDLYTHVSEDKMSMDIEKIVSGTNKVRQLPQLLA